MNAISWREIAQVSFVYTWWFGGKCGMYVHTAEHHSGGSTVLINILSCHTNCIRVATMATQVWAKLHTEIMSLMSSGLCEEEPQLEAVHLHDIWASKLGWMPSAMHLSFYLTHTYGRKMDRVVAVALSCLAHPIHVLAVSPAPGHAVVPTYEKT